MGPAAHKRTTGLALRATSGARLGGMKQNKPAAPRPPTAPAATTQVDLRQTEYSGQIPPPHLLRQFDELIPGTAARIIQWAEDEQRHRQAMEREAQAANVSAQQRDLDNVRYQTRAIVRNDALGQVLGFLICVGCAAAAVYLGLQGQTAVALGLVAIPTAAVVQAFRVNFFEKK